MAAEESLNVSRISRSSRIKVVDKGCPSANAPKVRRFRQSYVGGGVASEPSPHRLKSHPISHLEINPSHYSLQHHRPDVEMEDASTVSPSDQLVENPHNQRHGAAPSYRLQANTAYLRNLGNLLLCGANPSTDNSPATLAATARECAQSLVNQLLTVCTVHPLSAAESTSHSSAPSTPLPREEARSQGEEEDDRSERIAA